MKFSIIIPTLNEEQNIKTCLLALQHLRSECEIIIVDGESSDSTQKIATPLADKMIISPKGRAKQMNNGANQAKGEILIFLHADTYLPKNALQLIQQQICNNRQWGRFDIQLNGNHPMYKVIAQMMNWRSRLTGIATGDQVIFVTCQAFVLAGQYPEINLMEDIVLCKALKKISTPICLKDKVISSNRRWKHNGLYRTILLMCSIRLRYALGANPQNLAILYNNNLLTQFKFNDLWKRVYPPSAD
jgi:rSAM/selenodomain-associated transferase 2